MIRYYCGVTDETAAMFFSNEGRCIPLHKKRKESSDIPITGSSFSKQTILQPYIFSPNMKINMDELQIQYPCTSTICSGQPSFKKPRENMFLCQQSDVLTAQISLHNEETDRFLRAQADQLRRTLLEKRMKSYKSLLVAAEESATEIIRRKEEELERTASLTVELEKQVAQLEMESSALQVKAISEQSKAIALYAQLQRAAAAAATVEPAPAEDAHSACVDTDWKTNITNALTCRVCRMRPVSMLLLPCRHVSLCEECCVCVACPVCDSRISDSVQIHVS